MKILYKARDIIEAHIISGLLKSNGINSHVGGHYLQGGVGDLATIDFVTINVADEESAQATLIIKEYEKNNIQAYNTYKTDQKNKIIFTVPLLVLVISIIMILLLAVVFSDYK